MSLRSNNSSSSSNSSSNSENNDFTGNNNKLRLRTLNNEEIVIKDIEKNLQNWTIPKIPTYEIYQKGSFNFKSDYVIILLNKQLVLAIKN